MCQTDFCMHVKEEACKSYVGQVQKCKLLQVCFCPVFLFCPYLVASIDC